jgi:hypothetical protein
MFVSNGRAQDILHFLPLLLDLDSSLTNAAAQGNDTTSQRCMLLRIVAEACKLGGQLQQALRAQRKSTVSGGSCSFERVNRSDQRAGIGFTKTWPTHSGHFTALPSSAVQPAAHRAQQRGTRVS